jgi:hypothetical protein
VFFHAWGTLADLSPRIVGAEPAIQEQSPGRSRSRGFFCKGIGLEMHVDIDAAATSATKATATT